MEPWVFLPEILLTVSRQFDSREKELGAFEVLVLKVGTEVCMIQVVVKVGVCHLCKEHKSQIYQRVHQANQQLDHQLHIFL